MERPENIGKPQANHRKTIGKPHNNCDFSCNMGISMGFALRTKLVITNYERNRGDFMGYDSWILIFLVLNAGNGWVAGGCWDDDITSDDWDHSLIPGV